MAAVRCSATYALTAMLLIGMREASTTAPVDNYRSNLHQYLPQNNRTKASTESFLKALNSISTHDLVLDGTTNSISTQQHTGRHNEQAQQQHDFYELELAQEHGFTTDTTAAGEGAPLKKLLQQAQQAGDFYKARLIQKQLLQQHDFYLRQHNYTTMPKAGTKEMDNSQCYCGMPSEQSTYPKCFVPGREQCDEKMNDFKRLEEHMKQNFKSSTMSDVCRSLGNMFVHASYVADCYHVLSAGVAPGSCGSTLPQQADNIVRLVRQLQASHKCLVVRDNIHRDNIDDIVMNSKRVNFAQQQMKSCEGSGNGYKHGAAQTVCCESHGNVCCAGVASTARVGNHDCPLTHPFSQKFDKGQKRAGEASPQAELGVIPCVALLAFGGVVFFYGLRRWHRGQVGPVSQPAELNDVEESMLE